MSTLAVPAACRQLDFRLDDSNTIASPQSGVQEETTLFLRCVVAVAQKAVLVSEAGLEHRSPQQVAADFARLLIAAAAGMTPVERAPTPVLLIADQSARATEVL